MRGYPPRCVTSKSVCLDEFCDACQGRVETVLDCFQSCQSDEWWEDNEPFTRVSSRIEPAYLFKFTTTCGILDFPVFEKYSTSVRLPPPPQVLSVCFTALGADACGLRQCATPTSPPLGSSSFFRVQQGYRGATFPQQCSSGRNIPAPVPSLCRSIEAFTNSTLSLGAASTNSPPATVPRLP